MNKKLLSAIQRAVRNVYVGDISSLRQTEKNYSGKTEKVHCNLCGADDYKEIVSGIFLLPETKAVICKRCGLIYLNPRMSETTAEEFYGEHYRALYEAASDPTNEIINEYDLRAKRRFDFLRKIRLKPKMKVLEIGCNAGNLLHLFQKNGCIVEGIEPNRKYARYGKERYGLDIHTSTLEKTTLQNKPYDLVCIINVIEHLRDPKAALQYIYGILNKNGKLFLETSDISQGLKRRIFVPQWFHDAHLYDFSQSTILALLGTAGFRIDYCDHDEPKPPFDKQIRIIASKNNTPSPLIIDKHHWKKTYKNIKSKLWESRVRKILFRMHIPRFIIKKLF